MNSLIRTCLCMALCFSFSASTSQLYGQVVYTITGFTDNLGSDDPLLSGYVLPGGTYVAEFEVDESVVDTDPSADRGVYPGAILSSSIEFSSGYTSQVDFAGGEIVIEKDRSGGGIIISPTSGESGIVIYDLLNAFDSDALITDPETQIFGAQDSLALFEEPSGLVISFGQAEIGLDGNSGPMQFSVTLGDLMLLGDVNQDTAVDFLDIGPFISLLTSGGFQGEADIDQSGAVDFLDIGSFISLLSL